MGVGSNHFLNLAAEIFFILQYFLNSGNVLMFLFFTK